MRTEEYLSEVERYSANNYHPLPVVLTRGEGVYVWDVDGKRYFDMLSGYSALNQGHTHPRLVRALTQQAQKLTLTSRAFHNDQMGRFLHRVCELTGFEAALPMNTGAEAVETAIKAARKWGYDVKHVPQDRAEIIAFEGNFHGRTTTIVSFSTDAVATAHYAPYTPGFRLVPYGDLAALEAAVDESTVAVLLEPIQGEGGVIIPPEGYLQQVRTLCNSAGVLMGHMVFGLVLGILGCMAKAQREISVSEFFAKNRHLLGFDNPRKALLTTVKEAVDNSLDACEEAGILPEIWVHIEVTGNDRYKVGVQDNGPGILKKQIPLIFGKLLYGSKFHRLRQSRGQQGIGISAAGMYGVQTTGKPVKIISKVSVKKPAHYYEIQIDTKKNQPQILNGRGEGVDIPPGQKGPMPAGRSRGTRLRLPRRLSRTRSRPRRRCSRRRRRRTPWRRRSTPPRWPMVVLPRR